MCICLLNHPREYQQIYSFAVLGDTDELVRFEVIDQDYEQVKRSFILEEYALMARC